MKHKLIYADDLKDLMYVACMGQDKEFVKVFEMVIDDCPEAILEEKIETNADKIRSMTDEELAEWFMDGDCPCDYCDFKYKSCGGESCYNAMEKWLKQKVKEE